MRIVDGILLPVPYTITNSTLQQ